MKYIAVFDVPDDWVPNKYAQDASACFERAGDQLLSVRPPMPGDCFRVERARLKKLPGRIPVEWDTLEAAGFNACLDLLESG